MDDIATADLAKILSRIENGLPLSFSLNSSVCNSCKIVCERILKIGASTYRKASEQNYFAVFVPKLPK
jgi:hypothetical protein